MDHGVEAFCLADPLFYDSLLARGGVSTFALAHAEPPAGWVRTELDDWIVLMPAGAQLPRQGWKIHASGCLDNADHIIRTVADYCVPRGVAFKFVRATEFVLLRNAKYADRGSSGKLVTIYPADEAELQTVLTELGAALAGQEGPYILSDLRWGNGPLYVRYGGFVEQMCLGPDGQLEPGIADGEGNLVPDRRGPTFVVPAWVTLPEFLEPHLRARAATTVADLPYRIERALHFSNGGGLYTGVDTRTGRQVVLKEARPHAGLTLDGVDAVTRLLRERDALERLSGLDAVPQLLDHFTVGEHHFLVEEFVAGTPLHSELVHRYPLTLHEAGPAAFAEHTDWALRMQERVEAAVAAVHGRGVVIGDVHPFNILVRPDGRVVLIDFEGASPVQAPRRQAFAAPGFIAPVRRAGTAVDDYALACLRIFLFLPLTSLLSLQPAKARDLVEEIRRLYPVPDHFLGEALHVLLEEDTAVSRAPDIQTDPQRRNRRRSVADPLLQAPALGAWERARESIAAAIVRSATPQRSDRLYPGDVKQFAFGGTNMAYGAAGVLFALHATGITPDPAHEEWLVTRALHPATGTRMGFYDGLAGVAYALERLGRPAEALKVFDMCSCEVRGRWDRLGLDLFGGVAGIALTALHLAAATGDPALTELAAAAATSAADRLGGPEDLPVTSGGEHPYAGLIRGRSGTALLFVRMHESTGDAGWLDHARIALAQDLRRCVRRDDGVMEVDEGWRTMPYVADGSVGIGFVVDDYLRHRGDEELADAAVAIRRAARGDFYIEPGLFYGRAGMILYLARDRTGRDAHEADVVTEHVRRLSWHAIDLAGDLAFPGDQLLRVSMDLATGGAGVLLALGAALHDRPVTLPFLESAAGARPPHSGGPTDEPGRR